MKQKSYHRFHHFDHKLKVGTKVSASCSDSDLQYFAKSFEKA